MVLKLPPPGITPPFLLTFDASSAPAIQLVSSSAKISDAKIFDFAQNVIRRQLAMAVGAVAPSTCGGKVRQPRIGVDQAKLCSYGLSAQDVSSGTGSARFLARQHATDSCAEGPRAPHAQE